MAVDIDSLHIEIEASSCDAAAKIDALATALTHLNTAERVERGLLQFLSRCRHLQMRQS